MLLHVSDQMYFYVFVHLVSLFSAAYAAAMQSRPLISDCGILLAVAGNLVKFDYTNCVVFPLISYPSRGH